MVGSLACDVHDYSDSKRNLDDFSIQNCMFVKMDCSGVLRMTRSSVLATLLRQKDRTLFEDVVWGLTVCAPWIYCLNQTDLVYIGWLFYF